MASKTNKGFSAHPVLSRQLQSPYHASGKISTLSVLIPTRATREKLDHRVRAMVVKVRR
jgi:hypothetical protein